MPTSDDVFALLFLLLSVSLLTLLGILVVAPKSRISKRVNGVWNSPPVKKFTSRLINAFLKLFFGLLAVAAIAYYFNESSWYPREREVRVFFTPNHWIQGEIQTCYSDKTTTPQKEDEEIQSLSCHLETDETHVLRVKFWGPIKGDTPKVWKCERFPTTLTCRLQ